MLLGFVYWIVEDVDCDVVWQEVDFVFWVGVVFVCVQGVKFGCIYLFNVGIIVGVYCIDGLYIVIGFVGGFWCWM